MKNILSYIAILDIITADIIYNDQWHLGKTSIEKNVFFRAFPQSPTPPPDPKLGNLVLFYGRQKRCFARMTEIFFDDDNDGFNDNYDDNFDDNYDKND